MNKIQLIDGNSNEALHENIRLLAREVERLQANLEVVTNGLCSIVVDSKNFQLKEVKK